MKEVRIIAPEKILIDEVEIPEISEEEVLVKIIQVGICGTDRQMYLGEHSRAHFPVVPCHEAIGRIVEIGSKVTMLQPGDKVILNPQRSCHQCKYCLSGNENRCSTLKVNGIGLPGFAREYVAIDYSQLFKMPEHLLNDYGTLVEPVAAAYEMIKRAGIIEEKDILILGGGIIGNIAGQLAILYGANKVLIAEPNKMRRKISEACGLNVINPNVKATSNEIDQFFNSIKPDIIFECSGERNAINNAIGLVAIGGTIVIIGNHSIDESIDVCNIQQHMISIVGTKTYTHRNFVNALEIVNKGFLNLKPLITEHITIDYMEKAFKNLCKNTTDQMKIIITME